MFDFIYEKLYSLGLTAAEVLGKIFKWLFVMLAKPFKALGSVLYAGFFFLDEKFFSTVRNARAETKELVGEVKSTSSGIREMFKINKKQGWSIFKYYARKAFAKHGVVFSVFTNVVLPVFAFAVLCVTVYYCNSMKLGLKITYNNSDIGIVDRESVYLDAQSKAEQRLETAIKSSDENEIIKSTQYEIVPVSLTDLNDSESIAKKMIERSGSNITNACGIYIDGEFLCAVKNETDAVTVFDNILKSYDAGGDGTVSFVEDIAYIQGMYPDNENTIWDAVRLSERLAGKKNEATYYAVQSGDTPSGIAQKFGISTAKLYELNPSAKNNLYVGEKLMITSEVNFIRVQVTRTETRTVSIPFKTITTQNPNLYKGTKKTVKTGVNGEQLITERVTYIDGVKVKVQEISRVTTREPVDEQIQVGGKTYAVSSYGTVSSGTVKNFGGRFIWPAIGAYNVSSGFGGRRRHGGIDIVKPGGNSTGCTIVAAGSGTVVSASYHPSWGYNVLINHGNGVMTRYAHMLPGSFKVSGGQHVSAGQAIGNVGSSGNVTGPHLHFEVYINGSRVNPMPYLGR